MSAYDQPSEYLPSFSSGDFHAGSDTLTLAKGNSLYARLSGSNIMSGALNTFRNAISVMGVTISSTLGSGNTSININSTSNSSGTNNICVGTNSGLLLTTGYNNMAIGLNALSTLTIGINNTAIGYSSGINITGSSSENINIGFVSSGVGNCQDCVSIGANSIASVSNSVAIGYASQANNLNSTAVGYNTNVGYNNSTAIGTGATSTAINQIMLGTTNETTQIAGLLNVIKTATFTLPSFLSPPIMNYTTFSPVAYQQGYQKTSTTLVSNSITPVNTVLQVATITIPHIGLYLVDGYFNTVTLSTNSTIVIILNTAVAQNIASQTTYFNGGALQQANLKITYIFNITTANTPIYLCGFVPTGGVSPILLNTTQLQATRL